MDLDSEDHSDINKDSYKETRTKRRSARRSTKEERRQSLNTSIDNLKRLRQKRKLNSSKVGSILSHSKSRLDLNGSV